MPVKYTYEGDRVMLKVSLGKQSGISFTNNFFAKGLVYDLSGKNWHSVSQIEHHSTSVNNWNLCPTFAVNSRPNKKEQCKSTCAKQRLTSFSPTFNKQVLSYKIVFRSFFKAFIVYAYSLDLLFFVKKNFLISCM